MKYALRMELIGRNPVALVSPPATPKQESYSPIVEQVLALLAFAEDGEHPLWPFIHLIAYTGMRRGEALALTWGKVDLDNLRLLVAQSLVVTTVGVMLQPPKTDNGERVVDLDKDTVTVLRAHRTRQQRLAQQLGIGPPQLVFPRSDLTSWAHPNTVMHAVESMARRAGYPEITMRSLRHFHGSVTLQTGQNPVVVSQRLGHSSPTITMNTYAHALSGWQKDAATAFAQAMRLAV